MPNITTKHAITYTNSPVLLFKAIFRHRNYFLSFVAMNGNDGYGLKREKVGPTFSSFIACENIRLRMFSQATSFNAVPAILWLVFPDEIYLIFSS